MRTSVLFLFGAPRSGTTWLGKIFDSHPAVLYRHEPDSAVPTKEFPYFCPADQVEHYIDGARRYVQQLESVRHIKATGTLPMFRKQYHSSLEHAVRRIAVLTLKLSDRLDGLSSINQRLWIPDFITPTDRRAITPVIKSVVALGRARLFDAAIPDSKTIVLVRHPCGHVASVLRGVKLKKFPGRISIRALSRTEQAQRRGMTLEDFERMDAVEQITWHWAILNEKALEETQESNRTKVVRYEDLCDQPLTTTRNLFSFAGLDWCDQTERFLHASTSGESGNEYYRIFRDPKVSAEKWKQELDVDTIDRVIRIANKTRAGSMYENPDRA